ncbi:TELO2-interacting protein 1, partial [Lecanoromycetidae sp. Uapishka_2]
MENPRVMIFRTLKPQCVELSQVATQYKSNKATGKDLVRSSEKLLEALRSVSEPTNSLDPKLADYAFFPLIPIFRGPKELPLRAIETAVQSLQILIAYGWRTELPDDVGKQLLILLCFIAGGSAKEAKVKDVNEEVGGAAFDCLASLFKTSKGSFLGASAIVSENIPVFGHSVTVILDGITDGPSVRVRLAALAALDSMMDGISDDEGLKNVFPGIVSALTKVLSSKSSSKRSVKVLAASLVALTKTLCNVIGDDKVPKTKDVSEKATAVVQKEDDKTRSWATATAAQVKMALANILPLRYHDRSESTNAASKSMDFSPVLFGESSNRTTMSGLQNLSAQLKTLPMSTSLQQTIINTLRTTSGDEQLASLWLSLQLLNDTSSESFDVDQYLNLPPDQDAEQPMLDDIHSFSVDILSKSTFEDEDRWKLQALSLEAVALQARAQKSDFRPELVDALYPILERLGSSNAALQQHAMTCLNIVSNACEYPNSAALVVDNADYLVNAVALKLNTFDISPQAPQVLVMMVRLCGSALIPYLDDLVESVFSVLACYHGYPKLVESLFSVLNAIVEEAAKTSTPAIKPTTDTTTRPQPYKPPSISDLATILRSNLKASIRPLSLPPSPPLKPTTRPSKPFSEEYNKNEDDEEEENKDEPPSRPTTPPPLP